MTTPAEALKAVAKVLEERGEQNGPFEENFKNIAQVWTWWLKIRRGLAADLDASDVAALMALFKMARMLTGTLNRDDHYDNLGYGALLWGCMAEKIEATERAGTNKPSRRSPDLAVLDDITNTFTENYRAQKRDEMRIALAKELQKDFAKSYATWTTGAPTQFSRLIAEAHERQVAEAEGLREVPVWTTAALEEYRREAQEYREHVKRAGNFFNPDETQ